MRKKAEQIKEEQIIMRKNFRVQGEQIKKMRKIREEQKYEYERRKEKI
jgi:hypothetical protein